MQDVAGNVVGEETMIVVTITVTVDVAVYVNVVARKAAMAT